MSEVPADMETDVLYIVIPAYNEEANIRQVIGEWYPVIEKHNGNGQSRLVIVDDGSKDHTYQIIQECMETRPYLCGVTKPNAGHGATVLYGYQYALKHSADYVFQTDSDGQTRPEEFEPFWEVRKNCDMAIGHRAHREDGFSRVFVTKTLKLVIKLCFGVTVKDANTPYRLMNAGRLKEALRLIPDGFYLSNVILSVIYARKGYRVIYFPITFRPRQGGTNSINIPRICRIGMDAVKDFRKIRKNLDASDKGVS